MCQVCDLTNSFLALKRPNTRRAYKTILKQFYDWARWPEHWQSEAEAATAMQSQSISRALVYANILQRHLSTGSLRQRLDLLSSWFELMKDGGLVKINPFRLVLKRMPLGRVELVRPTKLISSEAMSGAFDSELDPELRCAISCLFGGALRRSEMLGLELRDVTFNPCVLQIRDTKGGRDRSQVIAEPFSAWIRDWYNTRLLVTGNQDSILCTFSESTFYRKYKKLFGAGCHSARATAATNLLQTGFDHLAVQKLLGHSSLAMVEVYDKRWNSLENHPGRHLFKNLLTKSA